MRVRERREPHVQSTWKRSSIFLLIKGNALISDGALERWPCNGHSMAALHSCDISANASGAQSMSDALR